MTTVHSIKPIDEPVSDPIPDAQALARQARQMLNCVITQIFNCKDPDAETVLVPACEGIARLLKQLEMELEPQSFRKAVLASKAGEVSHG